MKYPNGNWDETPGLVRLLEGDVLNLGPDGLVVVDRMSDCAARVRPLTQKTREFTPRFKDEKVVIKEAVRGYRIATQVEPATIVARLGADWQSKDFAASVPGYDAAKHKKPNGQKQQTKEQTEMKTATTDDGLSRGGLAAEALREQRATKPGKKAKAPKAAKEPKAAKPAKEPKAAKAPKAKKEKKAKAAKTGEVKQMPKIHGHSVCAVLRRLGKEGVTTEQAKAILAANGINDMPAASLAVQVGFGRTGKRPAADLTAEQVKELIAQAK